LSATIVLGLKLIDLKGVIDLIDKNAIKWGVIIITLGILTPFVNGRIELKQIKDIFTSPIAIVALLAGFVTVTLSGRGLNMISDNPSVVVGIIMGSLIGIAFFKGVPVGPLTAAGIVAVVMSFIKH